MRILMPFRRRRRVKLASVSETLRIRGQVCVVLQRDGKTIDVRESRNIVTTAGDLNCAELWAQEAPANLFGIMELGTAGTAPAKTHDRSDISAYVASSQKAFTSGYPKTNDVDADNTGKGVDIVTWLTSYSTAEAIHAAIDRVFITNVSPGASEPLMMYAALGAPVNKTGADTMKVFVNEQPTGV